MKISNSDNKRFLIPMKNVITEYQMIEGGDKVAIGLSGGKDSTTLLYLLTALQKKMKVKFEIVPISLMLGFEGVDFTEMKQFVESLGHTLYVQETNISEVVFDIRKEKNPCSLCANMRRGSLYSLAKELGCNKVALGHHLDDGMETFFMNLLFNGKIGSFQPVTYLDRMDITLIRPMIAIEEKQIIQFVQSKNLPIVHNPCPADKKTKREETKQLIETLSEQYPDLRQKFYRAIRNVQLRDTWNVEN